MLRSRGLSNGSYVTYKLCSWNGSEEVVKAGEIKVLLGPGDEALQVCLVDGADGVLKLLSVSAGRLESLVVHTISALCSF